MIATSSKSFPEGKAQQSTEGCYDLRMLFGINVSHAHGFTRLLILQATPLHVPASRGRASYVRHLLSRLDV